MAVRSRVPVTGTLGPLYLIKENLLSDLNVSVGQLAYLKNDGPVVMAPLARLERRQQMTMMAVMSSSKKMPTVKTAIMTTFKLT